MKILQMLRIIDNDNITNIQVKPIGNISEILTSGAGKVKEELPNNNLQAEIELVGWSCK